MVPRPVRIWIVGVVLLCVPCVPEPSWAATACATAADCYTQALERLQSALDAVEQPQKQVADLKAQVAALSVETASLREQVKALTGEMSKKAGWNNVLGADGSLGELPYDNSERAYHIPEAAVPDEAKEILVFVRIAISAAGSPPLHGTGIYSISTRNADEIFTMRLLESADSDDKGTWAWNSDNLWLPMPKDRTLYAQLSGVNLSGVKYHNSEVLVLGWR